MDTNSQARPKIVRTGSWLTEVLGALLILASPTLMGAFVGGYFYLNNPSALTQWLLVGLTGLGLFIGIWWAAHEWKSRGTVWFVSRLMATPELDQKD